ESYAGFPYDITDKSAMDVSPEERLATYERLWGEEGGFKFIYGSYYDLLFNKDSNDTAAEFIRGKIREIVEDPAVAEKLAPKHYPYGTKRPPVDTDYFETFNRPNVTLVDLRETPITEIVPSGIRTSDTTYELDVIVFATGFDAVTGALRRIDIRGRDGRTLSEKWEEGPTSYLGLQVARFPNLFTISGPGCPGVLANMPTAIEHHVEWIADCIAYLRANGFTRIEASSDAEDAWVEHVREVAERTLYPLADSWYLGANVPGKKRVFMPYVGGFLPYTQRCQKIADGGYEGFTLSTM
ncbi:MAG: NAD(P)/FAD-dependent oxidoreductase, partial [Acidimicrobiia bacterium]|nr:NAD(P)/FAD-dependent oxidoreductase [Acidimicrobiia bacterium]